MFFVSVRLSRENDSGSDREVQAAPKEAAPGFDYGK